MFATISQIQSNVKPVHLADKKYSSDCEFTGECKDFSFRVPTFLTG